MWEIDTDYRVPVVRHLIELAPRHRTAAAGAVFYYEVLFRQPLKYRLLQSGGDSSLAAGAKRNKVFDRFFGVFGL